MSQETVYYPLSADIVGIVLARIPMHRKFLVRAIADLTSNELAEVERYLDFLIREGVSTEEIATSYSTIVQDTFIEELRFRKTGRYRFSTFAESQAAVYDNEHYMRRYMIGLALSSFWWSNHMRMRRFFQKQLPFFSSKSGIYREVGPGHGMYFLESMRNCAFDSYEGIDISSTSVEMTKRVVNSGFFGSFPDARIILRNFLDQTPLVPSEVLVMGEVLEHVEEPSSFLQRAYQTTTDTAVVFLTTCINAPAIDHLYNPESIQNLEQLFFDNGFVIHDRCIVPRDGATLDECLSSRLAINVAYVLVKPGPI